MVSLDYAAGYFDGEGTVGIHADRSARICFCNTHLPSLEAIRNALQAGTIIARNMSRAGGLGKKQMYELRIHRIDELQRIVPELAARCIVKREALAQLQAHITGRRSVHRQRAIMSGLDPAEVARLYHGERLSAAEIGERLGVATGTVETFMQRKGIPCRNRKDAMRLAFDSGRCRRKNSPLSEVDPEEIRRLYWDEGLTPAEIAARYGVFRTSIRGFMLRHGIALRSPQEVARLRNASRSRGVAGDAHTKLRLLNPASGT